MGARALVIASVALIVVLQFSFRSSLSNVLVNNHENNRTATATTTGWVSSLLTRRREETTYLTVVIDGCIPVRNEWFPTNNNHGAIYLVTSCSHDDDAVLQSFSTLNRTADMTQTNEIMCVLGDNLTSYHAFQCLRQTLAPNVTSTVVLPNNSKSTTQLLSLLSQNNLTTTHRYMMPHNNNMTSSIVSKKKKKGSNGLLLQEHAVVVLSCSQTIDFRVLADIIPSYARKITILAECNKDESPHSALPGGLMGLHPMAEVRLKFCDDSSSNSTKVCHFAMMDASLLICQSSSLVCLLASSVLKETIPTVVLVSSDSADSMLAQHLATISSSDRIQLLHPRDYNNSNKTFPSLRNRQGTWKYDPTYHEKRGYWDQKWLRSAFKHADPQKHNKYVWKDTHASVQQISKKGFCTVMQKLGFRRLFALGDSLQYMAMIAFSHLLTLDGGKVRPLHRHLDKGNNMTSKQTVRCSATFSVELEFHRHNTLWPIYGNLNDVNASVVVFGKNASLDIQARRREASKRRIASDLKGDKKPWEYFNCWQDTMPDEAGNCPWFYDYVNNPVPTLLWTGVGSHVHQEDIFQESLDNFEKFFLQTQRNRTNDMVLFRTLHPGHLDCAQATEPFKTFRAFLSSGRTTRFDWHKFVHYNQVVQDFCWRRRQKRTSGIQVGIHDIYWMTALRRDGHPSAKDCLHYLLAGPPDWWIHTLYSQLLDLAALSQ